MNFKRRRNRKVDCEDGKKNPIQKGGKNQNRARGGNSIACFFRKNEKKGRGTLGARTLRMKNTKKKVLETKKEKTKSCLNGGEIGSFLKPLSTCEGRGKKKF